MQGWWRSLVIVLMEMDCLGFQETMNSVHVRLGYHNLKSRML